MSLASQIPGIEGYSVGERLRLIEELWDSIPDDPGALQIPEAHKDELDRRLEAIEADPLAGSSWEDVKTRLRQQAGAES